MGRSEGKFNWPNGATQAQFEIRDGERGRRAAYHEKGASFSSWLFAIVRNLTLNELDRRHHRIEIAPTGTGRNPLESVDDCAEDPLRCLERKETRGQVLNAAHQLPDPSRQAVALSCFQELSIKEVAETDRQTPSGFAFPFSFALLFCKRQIGGRPSRHR